MASHVQVSSNTGSLVNFNLSTIFPEINIQQGPGPNCQADTQLAALSFEISISIKISSTRKAPRLKYCIYY